MEQIDDGGGDCNSDCIRKLALVHKIQKKHKNIKVKTPNDWQYEDLQEVQDGLYEINGQNGFDGNTGAFNRAFGNVTFVPLPAGYFSNNAVGDAAWSTGVIRLEPDATKGTVVHEMGHILSGSLKRLNNRVPSYAVMYAHVFDSGIGATDYGRKNGAEDFADSFLAVIKYGPLNNPKINTDRVKAILTIIQSFTNSGRPRSPGR